MVSQRYGEYRSGQVPRPFINETGSHWASRYPALWPIPGAIVGISRTDCRRDAARCAEFRHILADARRATIADMKRYQPELVFIDVRRSKSYFGGQPFDYLAFLSIDPAFAPMWSRYRKVGEMPGFEVWRRGAAMGNEREESGSPSRIRTYGHSINSRMLYR